MKSFSSFLHESTDSHDPSKYSSEQKDFHDVLTKHGFKYSHTINNFGDQHVYVHPNKGKVHLGRSAAQHAEHPPKDAPENHMTTYSRYESDSRPAHYKNGPRDLDDALSKNK